MSQAKTSHYRPKTSGITKTKQKSNINHEIKWIKRHINIRKCKRFVGKAGSRSDIDSDPECYCGRKWSEHSSTAREIEPNNLPWNWKTHTRAIPNNTYGEVEFLGYGEQSRKYARVDINSSMDDMKKLTMDIWGLEKPNLLISVTGGARDFTIKPQLKDIFRRGLMKVARSTGAWITTGGTNLGVMKHVGEAVRDYGLTSVNTVPVVVMGIATWGIVQSKESLIQKDCSGKWPAMYRIEQVTEPNESFLDPNHTHFIMVDDGTVHQFGKEIQFRASFENAVSRMKTNTGRDAVSIPVVLLVLQGGPGTLETVRQSIANEIPVVIIEGTGKAADILATAYNNSDEIEIVATDQEGQTKIRTQTVFSPELEVKIHDMVKEHFGDKDLHSNIKAVKECILKRDLVTVFELGSSASQDVDMAILKALLKANKDQVFDQLKLALAWNRIDIAKSEIFTDERSWPRGSLNDIMFSALLTNRVDFVKLFLEHGVSVREFFTKKRLLQLYNMIGSNTLLFDLLKKDRERRNSKGKYVSLHDVGHLVKELIGDFYLPRYLKFKKYSEINVDAVLDEEQIQDGDTLTTKDGPLEFENPHQDIFLWSVLMNQQKLAKLFWKYSKDSIASALVASALLNTMSRKTDDTDLQHSLKKNSEEFSSIAMGVLSECYEIDEKQAQNLLVRELDNLGSTTCMVIAMESDNKHFISQTACQSLLNNIWNGQLDDDNHTITLLVSMVMPFAIFLLVTFTEKSRKDIDSKESKRKLTNNKDDKFTDKSDKKEFNRIPTRSKKETQDHTKLIDMERKKDNKSTKFTPVQKLFHFYTAPVVTFVQNVIFYLIFLALFSYELLTEFNTQWTVTEIILIVWVFSIFAEEVRQVYSSAHHKNISSYLSDTWNIVDVTTITLFLVGMVLRFLPFSNALQTARVVLGVNLVSFFFRLLHIFSVHKHLGPKLVMIGNMMVDLIYFMVILFVIVLSYSVAAYAILYPYSTQNGELLLKVLRLGYWNLYGELFLEDIESTTIFDLPEKVRDIEEAPDCTYNQLEYGVYGNGTQCATTVGKYVVPVLMGIYILFSNILLLNLLIAMFSNTFQKIQDNTDLHWYFQRYSLIYEYYSKPYLAPPLILISHVYMLFKWLLRKCCKSTQKEESDFNKRFPNERELIQWEEVVANSYIEKEESKERESVSNRMKEANDRMDSLTERMEELQEQMSFRGGFSPVNQTVSSTHSVSHTTHLDKRIKKLELKMSVISGSVEWISNAMKRNISPGTNIPQETAGPKDRGKTTASDEESKKNKELVKMFISKRLALQVRSRQSPYPGSYIQRFPVPDDFVFWEVDYPGYQPVIYESEEVKGHPFWADPKDVLSVPVNERNGIIKFNAYDTHYNVSRVSYMGPYDIVDSLPINPHGRTGIIGRGILGRWGPNHAGDPIITRWKMDKNGQVIKKDKKQVFEFVAIQRKDNQKWAIPGGFCDPSEKIYTTLRKQFVEEALGNFSKDEVQKKQITEKLDHLFSEGVEIYRGYSDDPRNTDNAWIETLVYHYHDEDGSVFSKLKLKAGNTVDVVSWITASSDMPLYATHTYYMKLVAESLKASF